MFKIIVQLALFALLVVPSYAEGGWMVSRVRGAAEQLAAGRWVTLERGAEVAHGQTIRTGADGRVGLARGTETVELEPGTQIELRDGAGKLTSLIQKSGLLHVDVERRNVQHFSVQTPFLAAVVKGTRFTVSVSRNAAHVSVQRGLVQVQDSLNDLVVDVAPGQDATVSPSEPLLVTGRGAVAVFTFDGLRVVNGTSDTPADSRGEPVQAGTSANGNGNDRGGGNGNGISGQRNGRGGGNGNDNNGQANGNGGPNGNGNSGQGNDRGGGNGNGNNGQGNGNGGGNGNGNNGQGSGNGGGNGNGNNGQGNGNGGGNGNGNNGQGNGNGGGNGNGNSSQSSSNGGGNGNGNNGQGNGNGGGNGNGNGQGNGNGNGGGNGNGNNGQGNGNGGGNSNSGQSNGGGNGNGNEGGNGNGNSGQSNGKGGKND